MIGILLFLAGRKSLSDYTERKKLVVKVMNFIKDRTIIRFDELVLKLGVSDTVLRDLLYELWQRDLIDISEMKGYAYIRPRAIR